MTRQLPESANLEHLKGQAKTLLLSLRSHDLNALERVKDLPARHPYRLADAQLAVAREYGFESWAKLKRHLVGYTDRRDALFAAIRAGDRDRVRGLLRHDPAMAASRNPGDFGSTTLNAAAHRDDQPMIELLLEYGADLDAISDWGPGGFRPLDFANEKVSSYLLSRGATLTAHAAARLGMAKALRDIIARNPDAVNERGGDGQYPLHFSKTAEIVDILLDAGADIDARDIDHEGTPLQNRIKVEPVARRLFERGATPDVFSAAALGEVSLLAELLDKDPDAITRRVMQPGNAWIPQPGGRHIYVYEIGDVQLHQVATNFGQDAVYELLWERSSPALRLAMAGWRGDREAALSVIRENPGIVSRMSPADMRMLPIAASERRLETVRLLLEIGFAVDVPGWDNFAAVNAAAFHGFDDVIEAILPYKPDLELKNPYGGTPLRCCLYGSLNGWRKDGDYPRSVELLIDAGSELPPEPYGSPECLQVLARHGMAV